MSEKSPRVSFVVPCYNYGRVLTECVDSILGQTFGDLEVIIMDDYSPDDTPDVARALAAKDARVRHVRNEPNLRHLRNYNKGIGLSKGDLVWLISADDKLRKPYVLERYVKLLDARSEVTFAFCPAAVFGDNGQETKIEGHYGDEDKVIPGEQFFPGLVRDSRILSPSVIARRSAYDYAGLFATDLPHQGDVHLWAQFAMKGDVAYFAEPMVGYRRHATCMTHDCWAKSEVVIRDQIEIPWRLRRRAEKEGRASLADACLATLAEVYARYLGHWVTGFKGIDAEQFERSLQEHGATPAEVRLLRPPGYAALGDWLYEQGEHRQAREAYAMALRERRWSPRTWIKYGLLGLGRVGVQMRSAVIRARGPAVQVRETAAPR
jgi:glycosyltransferase involved in cell wall biosynthesis